MNSYVTNMHCMYLQQLRTDKYFNEFVFIYFRNSTYCLKIKLAAKFIEHEPNLCYNAQAVFTQRLPVAGDGQLVCPYLEFLEDENNELPKIQWYKVILYYKWHFTSSTNKIVFQNRQSLDSAKYFFIWYICF